MDAACDGNLTSDDNPANVAGVRRFYFSQHHLCTVEGQDYDPTAGCVGLMTPLVHGMKPDPNAANTYVGGGYTVARIGEGPTGGVYKISPAP